MDTDAATDANDVSKVCANDTVDFGTLETLGLATTDDAALVVTDKSSSAESTQSESDSDNYSNGIDVNLGQPNATSHHSPQHSLFSLGYGAYDPFPEAPDPSRIDNRFLEYIPVRLACGIFAYCSPDVLRHCPMVLRSIQADLARALSILPDSVHSLVRRTNLWLNWNGYAYGAKVHPTILRQVMTHHHPAWLVEVANDSPRKAGGIEIYSCVHYSRMRLHWNGSGLLLHELCHLIHQCCLEDSLDNQTVEVLYEVANASGRYEKVLRRDWAGKSTAAAVSIRDERDPLLSTENATSADFDLAYAMVNKKEFFAEISVAFLCKGYRDLNRADPTVMEACSPPLLHPEVTERVHERMEEQRRLLRSGDSVPDSNTDDSIGKDLRLPGQDENEKDDDDDHKGAMPCFRHSPKDCWAPFPSEISNRIAKFMGVALQTTPVIAAAAFGMRTPSDENDESETKLLRMIDPSFRENATRDDCASIDHCNKFYPFTRGQLHHHDPVLCDAMGELWNEVALWEDPWASTRTKKRVQQHQSCTRWCPSLSSY